MSYNVPNLDASELDFLLAFWLRHNCGQNSRDLFPEEVSGRLSTTASLANYAASKATAQYLRLQGDIVAAQRYEHICELVYAMLPNWARW